jgi:hypothetical protein
LRQRRVAARRSDAHAPLWVVSHRQPCEAAQNTRIRRNDRLYFDPSCRPESRTLPCAIQRHSLRLYRVSHHLPAIHPKPHWLCRAQTSSQRCQSQSQRIRLRWWCRGPGPKQRRRLLDLGGARAPHRRSEGRRQQGREGSPAAFPDGRSIRRRGCDRGCVWCCCRWCCVEIRAPLRWFRLAGHRPYRGCWCCRWRGYGSGLGRCWCV